MTLIECYHWLCSMRSFAIIMNIIGLIVCIPLMIPTWSLTQDQLKEYKEANKRFIQDNIDTINEIQMTVQFPNIGFGGCGILFYSFLLYGIIKKDGRFLFINVFFIIFVIMKDIFVMIGFGYDRRRLGISPSILYQLTYKSIMNMAVHVPLWIAVKWYSHQLEEEEEERLGIKKERSYSSSSSSTDIEDDDDYDNNEVEQRY